MILPAIYEIFQYSGEDIYEIPRNLGLATGSKEKILQKYTEIYGCGGRIEIVQRTVFHVGD